MDARQKLESLLVCPVRQCLDGFVEPRRRTRFDRPSTASHLRPGHVRFVLDSPRQLLGQDQRMTLSQVFKLVNLDAVETGSAAAARPGSE